MAGWRRARPSRPSHTQVWGPGREESCLACLPGWLSAGLHINREAAGGDRLLYLSAFYASPPPRLPCSAACPTCPASQLTWTSWQLPRRCSTVWLPTPPPAAQWWQRCLSSLTATLSWRPPRRLPRMRMRCPSPPTCAAPGSESRLGSTQQRPAKPTAAACLLARGYCIWKQPQGDAPSNIPSQTPLPSALSPLPTL